MATIATTMTGAQFDALPYEEGRRAELIDGDIIPVSSPTPRHQKIVGRLLSALLAYIEQTRSGTGTYTDVEFALTERHRLRPDVCVLLAAKESTLDLDRVPIPGAPDLAVEVISPTERASESQRKVRAYLENGTIEVWRVYPETRSVEIHRGEISRFVEPGAELSSELLPGLAIPLESLFE
jgi:Uma2 family endonuclease